MAGRVFIGIITLVLFFGFFPVISTGIHDFRTDEAVQNRVVVTGVGETSADVVLVEPLFGDKTDEVESVTSTLETDTPVATTYVAGTQTLTIVGLTADETRTLTVQHYTAIDDQYMSIVGPFLTFLICGGVIGAVLWSVWRHRSR